LVASSVFDAALCSRSISHNPHADEHDPSACGGQLLIVGPVVKVIKIALIVMILYGAGMCLYLSSSNVEKFSDLGNNRSLYCLKEWPRSSLILCMAYLPALKVLGTMTGDVYRQGYQLQVIRPFTGNLKALFYGRPHYW
jgi:hypothetical protein